MSGTPGDPPLWTVVALGLLPLALLSVVLLAEILAVPVEHAVEAAELPAALVGVSIALVVLMPDAVASIRAARANRLQTSINLALGSAPARRAPRPDQRIPDRTPQTLTPQLCWGSRSCPLARGYPSRREPLEPRIVH